jgi:hypothetical protein
MRQWYRKPNETVAEVALGGDVPVADGFVSVV